MGGGGLFVSRNNNSKHINQGDGGQWSLETMSRSKRKEREIAFSPSTSRKAECDLEGDS